MEDWTKLSDEQVFSTPGEQQGSPAAYWREVEIQRRAFVLNQKLLRTQIDAVAAQKTATTAMVWTAGFAALSAVASLATAVVTYLVAK